MENLVIAVKSKKAEIIIVCVDKNYKETELWCGDTTYLKVDGKDIKLNVSTLNKYDIYNTKDLKEEDWGKIIPSHNVKPTIAYVNREKEHEELILIKRNN